MITPSDPVALAFDLEPVSMGVVAVALLVLGAGDAIRRQRRQESRPKEVGLQTASQPLHDCDDALSPL
jgi:hypothetical protein